MPREGNFGKIGTRLGSSISHKIECASIRCLIVRSDGMKKQNSFAQQILEEGSSLSRTSEPSLKEYFTRIIEGEFSIFRAGHSAFSEK
jgi:hypothetical protein